jgi:hypothetical protein
VQVSARLAHLGTLSAAASEDQSCTVFVVAAGAGVFCPPGVVRPVFETIPDPERLMIVPGCRCWVCAGLRHEAFAVAADWFAGCLRPAGPGYRASRNGGYWSVTRVNA